MIVVLIGKSITNSLRRGPTCSTKVWRAASKMESMVETCPIILSVYNLGYRSVNARNNLAIAIVGLEAFFNT